MINASKNTINNLATYYEIHEYFERSYKDVTKKKEKKRKKKGKKLKLENNKLKPYSTHYYKLSY